MRLKMKTVTAALTHLAIAGMLMLAFLRADAAREGGSLANPETRTAVRPSAGALAAQKRKKKMRQAPPALRPEDADGAAAPPAGAASPEPQNSAQQTSSASSHAALLDRLIKAYPDFLAGHDGKSVIWKDGTKTPFDDGKTKTPAERLELADLEDQFFDPYPVGRNGLNPPKDFDPGRVRHEPFFLKMYGDCKKGEVERRQAKVVWLPKHGGKKISITAVNGVAERLQRVSDELDNLPERFMKYLKPVSGIYNCRPIAGTARMSMHSYAAAIDINSRYGDYWQWTKPSNGLYVSRNRIPWEIVEIFEKHGFIWGGKWHHFDTQHFEYRPELLPEAGVPPSAAPSSPASTDAAAKPAEVKPEPPAAADAREEPAGPPLPLPERQPRKIP